MTEEAVQRPKRAYVRRNVPRTAVARTEGDAANVGVGAQPIPGAERAESIREADSEPVTRVSRSARSQDRFAIPAHRKKKGWDYQWWTITVLGQPVDSSAMAEIYEGGWRPCPASDFPELMVPGVESKTVDRFGQRLFMRPLHLSQEARAEDYQAAEQQKRDRVQGALEGRVKGAEGLSDIKGVRAVPLAVTVEGEVGSQSSRTPVR